MDDPKTVTFETPLKDQYYESKRAIEAMALQREAIRENVYRMLRVYFLAIAATATILGFADQSQIIQQLLTDPLCSFLAMGICVKANWVLGLLAMANFLSGIFFLLALSGSRVSNRSIGRDISDTLTNEYSPEHYLRTRLEKLRGRYMYSFLSTRIMDLALSAGVYFGMLGLYLFLILVFNVVAESPVTGWGVVPVIIVGASIIVLVLTAIISWKIALSDRSRVRSEFGEELVPEDLTTTPMQK
ncbi:hypothetical protein ACOZ4B_13830 [Haloferax prahovense]|uniref:hypothetical protein n=1 Tax=Haloferax prahovense TaxID=381852 RepID=UPI003C7644DF